MCLSSHSHGYPAREPKNIFAAARSSQVRGWPHVFPVRRTVRYALSGASTRAEPEKCNWTRTSRRLWRYSSSDHLQIFPKNIYRYTRSCTTQSFCACSTRSGWPPTISRCTRADGMTLAIRHLVRSARVQLLHANPAVI